MSFTEIAKKTGRGLALTAALFAAGSLAAAPSTAYARDWHGGGHWGGGHWGGGHWGGHHHGGGAGLAFGLIGGALAGAAIASAANPYYYPYSYSYAYPSYGYNPYGSYYPY
jgi:hypothetical protein